MDIQFLTTDNNLREICRAYWETNSDNKFPHKIKDIEAKFNISKIEIDQIVQKFCVAYSLTNFCQCGKPYIYVNRTNYSSSYKKEWKCKTCTINERQKAEEERQRIEDTQQEILLKMLNEHRLFSPVILSNLDVRSAVLLLSLIRFGMNEDLSYINEYVANKTGSFSPDPRTDISFLEELFQKEYIVVHPSSKADSIEIKNEHLSIYLDRVKWAIPLSEKSCPIEFAQHLENKISSMAYLDSSYDEIVEFAKEISLLECLAYLQDTMNEHDLSFNPGDKTKLVLAKALEEYSVAQVYCFIWRGVRDSAAYYMQMKETGISKKQAANTVVGKIERYFEQAINNNWSVKAFKRNYCKPQSIISQVLFNVLLHTDDGGFHSLINKLI